MEVEVDKSVVQFLTVLRTTYIDRFILHLKFFSQRLLLHENVMEEANFLYDQVEQNMSEAFLCAKKISTYIKKSYEYEISKSEIVYLTIHIQRLLTQGQKL